MIPGDAESVQIFVWRMFTRSSLDRGHHVSLARYYQACLPRVREAVGIAWWEPSCGVKHAGYCLGRRAWPRDEIRAVINIEDEQGLECDTTIVSGQ